MKSSFNGEEERRTEAWNSLQLFMHFLYRRALDYMWNIKGFNYLNYCNICRQESSLKPKGKRECFCGTTSR